MSVEKRFFGKTTDGQEVTCYTLTDNKGTVAEVLDFGVTVRTLVVLDKNKNPVDVVWGYDTAEEYETQNGCLGATIGRFANRIADGRFVLNGKEYNLPLNQGKNHIHGGPLGFNKRVWDSKEIENGVLFTITSPDGDAGYPGNLTVKVAVTLIDGAITFKYNAVSDKDTIINLTNHSYFNLNGDTNNIYEQLLTLNADSFLMPGEGGIPTGEIVPVKGTSMDFLTEHKFGDTINSDYPVIVKCGGYDNNYIINSNPAAVARSTKTGIVMTLTTDQPGVQLYTANGLVDRKGKKGVFYNSHGAFCLETQHYPDSIHHPEWPSPILKAGEEFNSVTTYAFAIDKD